MNFKSTKKMIIMANEELWINGRISDLMIISQSPFYKDSHYGKHIHGNPKIQKDMRISKSVYNDLMAYFKGNGWNWTDGMNHIINEKLNMINTSKRTAFTDIEIVMVIPKTRNLEELNRKSFILTVYNTKSDFNDSYVHHDGFNKVFNFNFELMDFSLLPINILSNLKRTADFHLNYSNPYDNISEMDYYKRLEEIHEINLSKCYIVRFPLNNYLDINREGQYQSSRLRGWHDGLYVFDDFNHHRLYFRLEWEYQLQSLHFRGVFLHRIDFMHLVKNADMKNVRESHESLLNNTHDREFMESALKDAEEMKEWIDKKIAFYKKNLGR